MTPGSVMSLWQVDLRWRDVEGRTHNIRERMLLKEAADAVAAVQKTAQRWKVGDGQLIEVHVEKREEGQLF